MSTYTISGKEITLEEIGEIISPGVTIKLSKESKDSIVSCRKYLDRKLKESGEPIYGINTGFGALYNKSVPEKSLSELQHNLVMSHACGAGEMVPFQIVKLMLLLKIKGLALGNSGVQLQTVERLIDYFNEDVLPVVYEQGSLGASGDLAPLAHLCLPLIGEGDVMYQDRIYPAKTIMKRFDWKPIELQSKEGLALLNGTQFMSAYGCYSYLLADRLAAIADLIATVSLEAYDGRPEPFDLDVHKVRPHHGQTEVAKKVLSYLKGSGMIRRKKQHVQDPYSLRCIPQVHGASQDAINYVAGVLHVEVNSVTDNPTVFPKEDKIISAGNFHGQPLAIAMDFLAIAVAELGSISERRTYLLISGERGLPPFLAAEPGLNSGFMIPQYTAASIVSQNKQLCTPASVDSIDSSNGQEDHVSMGANAATKLYKVVENLNTILAIELLTAIQAIEFRRPLRSSDLIESLITEYRKEIPFVEKDVVLYPLIQKSREFISNM